MRYLNICDTINIKGKQYRVVELDGNVTRCNHCPLKDYGIHVCCAYMNALINPSEYTIFPCKILLGNGRLELVSHISKWKNYFKGEIKP